jgi:hypothetical protein
MLKKLIVLIIFSLLTLKSISQNDTVSKDSIVCLPKSILINVIKDLEAGDACVEKIDILENNIMLCDTIVKDKNSIIYTLREKEKIHELDIKAYNITLTNINNDYKKSLIKIKRKNAIIIVSIGANLILGTTLYLVSLR